MLPYINKCLLFGLRKVKNKWQYLCIFENCITWLAFSLQPLYETLNAYIMILSFLVLNVQKASKDLISGLYNIIYTYIYIYIKKAIDYIINFNNFMTI